MSSDDENNQNRSNLRLVNDDLKDNGSINDAFDENHNGIKSNGSVTYIQPKSLNDSSVKYVGRQASGSSFTSIDSTARWNEDFSHRPSWCDAGMALKQINQGKADGFKAGLYLRKYMQRFLFEIGLLVQKYYEAVIIVGFLVMIGFACGLMNVRIQTDIVKLWVEQGGRLDEELNFLNQVKTQVHGNGRNARGLNPDGGKEESGLGGGFQVLIQTPSKDRANILNKKDLLLHAQVLEEISMLPLEMYGENWTLSDLCFKPPAPKVESALSGIVNPLLEKIIPCVIISPMDCFWEGSKGLGPHPPLDVGADVSILIPSLPVGEVTWKNLNPIAVLDDVSELFPIGGVRSLFVRAGIGSAYQERPCIDPMDPKCPKTSPNYFDICNVTLQFLDWNRDNQDKINLNNYRPPGIDILPVYNGTKEEKADFDDEEDETATDDYYGDYGGLFGGAFESPKEKDSPADWHLTRIPQHCIMYAESVRNLLISRPEIMEKFLTSGEKPEYPKYNEELTNGCNGFAADILNWPEEMIVGGISRQGGWISEAESLQSVMMVAGANDVYQRFLNSPGSKPNLFKPGAKWTSGMASNVVNTWQRLFTKGIYNHTNNSVDHRILHPLASTSVGDMLEEFSKFKPKIIIVGYFFMLLYAGLSLCSCKERGVQSCTGLGIAGVILVTFASGAGLGLSTILGIDFNAATTQIVPFLTLGLGVDDMFLLVHNYKEIVTLCDRHELGYLLKETGLSVLLTSINNILAFMTGGMLPVPALKSFCLQTAILLFFNMLAILSVFPAIMAVDLKRRKAKRVDILCCIPINQDKIKPTLNGSSKSNDHNANGIKAVNGPPYEEIEDGQQVQRRKFKEGGGCREIMGIQHWTLHHFVQHVYIPMLKPLTVKLWVLILALVLMGFGIVGLTRVQAGLELTDVIPRGTAPYAFLEARDKYFSFYPMFAVIKGPIEFHKKQREIKAYREAIGQSEFIVTNQGKLGEAYWLSMMNDWATTMQMGLDDAMNKGYVVLNASRPVPVLKSQASEEARMAVQLLCSVGETFDCSRIGNVRLVENGIINEDSFYNILTGWYNSDNMMYYVTQASFYPTPPSWKLDLEENLSSYVPPADPLLYSQIPFFLNGLVDTPKTVQMIKEVRKICDEYTAKGIPNFPKGIPFTFWEQYLHLVKNLCIALSIITLAVFCVITVLLMSPWTAAMIVLVLIMMVVELAGFMGLVGLKLNPVSAVSLITAVGIGVEFTVHVSLSFLTTLGTRQTRMERTLEHMFIPVLHGGISTLLGIIMLAFSEFEFIVRYFFTVMAALIVLGLINGLMVLPVILSLFGPRSEVRTMDGSHVLPPPTPPPREKTPNGHSGPYSGNELSQIANGDNRNGQPSRASLSTIEEEGLSPLPNANTNTVNNVKDRQVTVIVHGDNANHTTDKQRL